MANASSYVNVTELIQSYGYIEGDTAAVRKHVAPEEKQRSFLVSGRLLKSLTDSASWSCLVALSRRGS